jgi:hypothetical protein
MSEFFKSECGRFLCRYLGTGGNYEAWTADGCIHWRHDNRIQTWADQEKYKYPMVYSVGGYSAEKVGQKKGSFTLTLLHCDTTKAIEPFKGNTIIESVDIVFRRKVPAQHVPKWLRD